MQKLVDFKLPHFFNYPPYFTLQPVRDTREKQIQLWKELILDYCKTQKIFVIGLEEEFPLFTNHVIESKLKIPAFVSFYVKLSSPVNAPLVFLVISYVLGFAIVLTHYFLYSTELHGIDRTILNRALKLLEQKGKLVVFKGTSTDDEGVKFSL
uniref:Vacuolar protein sorting-associated protein 25 n=1 Tax=Cajanus cajan TaxID=3821 RepID=A0A151SI08_CAJCA|nr:Vacuolar protein sorting-associated protein 25 [Cajanus cajan]